ncbi:hypothetical protein H0178_38360 [Cytobacillus firmus]|nr:hypothetical protein [Cytobacillus firmus]
MCGSLLQMCEGMPGDGGLSRGTIEQMDDAGARYMLEWSYNWIHVD